MDLLSEPAVITAVAAAGPRDRLLTFLTRNQGGVRIYVRPRPRRAQRVAFYEPLQGGELVYSRSRAGGHGRLSSFVPQRVWPGVRQDFPRLVQALAFLETVNLCLTEGEPLPELFALLVGFLDRLESDSSPGLARITATLRLLVLSGFAPSLVSCVGCRSVVPTGTGVLMSPEGGGVVCRSCSAGRTEQTIPISPGAHGFMVRALCLPDARSRRLRISAVAEREVAQLLDALLEARTGVRPRSRACIDAMTKGV